MIFFVLKLFMFYVDIILVNCENILRFTYELQQKLKFLMLNWLIAFDSHEYFIIIITRAHNLYPNYLLLIISFLDIKSQMRPQSLKYFKLS